AQFAVQEPQLGTGHAVQQAQAALADFEGDVLVLYGDVPFVSSATMRAMIERLHGPDDPAAVVLAFEPEEPLQYGRVIADGDRVTWVGEHKDADEALRICRICNSGLLAARSVVHFELLSNVCIANDQGEIY